MGRPWAGTIVEKWPKIEFLGKCRENGVVIAWSSFTFTDIIAMVPSDINFVYKDRYGAMGSLISRHQGFKRPKMAKNGILSHFSPFVPDYGRPVNPTSTFIDYNVITSCCFIEIYVEKTTPSYYQSIFLPLAWKLNVWPFFTVCAYGWKTLWLTKMLSPGVIATISMERELLQSITTPLPENWIFGNF